MYIENVKTYVTKELPDKQNDCLLESPIDIPIRQTEIKKEAEFNDEQGRVANEEFINIGKNEVEIVKGVDEIVQFVKEEVAADLNAGENDAETINTGKTFFFFLILSKQYQIKVEDDMTLDPITTVETSWYKEKSDSAGVENPSNLDNSWR